MPEPKRILLITYYWPPSGGSGVQRWLKMIKYFPSNGISPVVFTPSNPHFSLKDPSLLKDVGSETEVLHFPIWEPYRLLERIQEILDWKKKSEQKKVSESKGLTAFIRANFFIPDPRVFWVKPSVQFLKDFIRDRQIQIIITTGPPHSVHLIGLKLKEAIPSVKWLADFRDPWTTWGFLLGLKPSFLAMRLHRKQEKNVLKHADVVTTVSNFYANQLSQLAGRQVKVITNGYDVADFIDLKFIKPSKFVLRHVGILHPACNPIPFLMVLRTWLRNQNLWENFQLVFTGQVHEGLQEFLRLNPDLAGIVQIQEPVDHQKLIHLYGETSAVLLLLTGYKDAEGFLPGKLFEYLATGLPIISVGPEDGDAARIIKEAGALEMRNSEDLQGIMSSLDQAYAIWSGNQMIHAMPESSRLFSREYLAKGMADFLKKL